ncbi:tail fiber domain-containing protein [Spongorhabdus nitratireducens]
MANETQKQTLKDYFKPGSVPTAAQFSELVDSVADATLIDKGKIGNTHLPDNIDLTGRNGNSEIKADTFNGDGAELTRLNAGNITQGTLGNARLPNTIDLTLNAGGTSITAGAFTGNGAALTLLDADNIADGTLNNARLPAAIDLTLNDPNSSFKAKQVNAAQVDISGGLQVDIDAGINGKLGVSGLTTLSDVTATGNASVQGMLTTGGESLTLLANQSGTPAKNAVIKADRGDEGELAILTFNESADHITVPVMKDGSFVQDEVAGKSWVSAEVAVNAQAVAAEKNRATTAESTLQQNIDTEAGNRQTADNQLQQAITTEKQRIDSILQSSDADKDSFAEIVALINSVDKDSDDVFAGYVTSNNNRVSQIETDLSAETSARTTAVSNLQTAVNGKATAGHNHDAAYYTRSLANSTFFPKTGGQLNGNLGVSGTITATGTITSNGDITAYSDRRLKQDIAPIGNALEKISQLQGITYSRNDLVTDKRSTGLIAQDVEAVMPEAVHECNGYLAVAYGNLTGLLVESIKELKQQVTSLQDELSALKKLQ